MISFRFAAISSLFLGWWLFVCVPYAFSEINQPSNSGNDSEIKYLEERLNGLEKLFTAKLEGVEKAATEKINAVDNRSLLMMGILGVLVAFFFNIAHLHGP